MSSQDCRAVGIVEFKILTVFRECKVCGFVSTIVDFICMFFCFKSCGVGDFDTDFTLNILDNVDRTIRRLFFEFISKLLSEKGMSSLIMTVMIDAEKIVFRVESPDRIELRTFNRSSIEAPITTFCFIIYFIA